MQNTIFWGWGVMADGTKIKNEGAREKLKEGKGVSASKRGKRP